MFDWLLNTHLVNFLKSRLIKDVLYSKGFESTPSLKMFSDQNISDNLIILLCVDRAEIGEINKKFK